MKNLILLSTAFLFSITSFAQETKTDSLKSVEVKNKYKYKREKSATVSKMPLKDIENPQVYNTVTSELIREQLVTNFNDAIKNATGITRLWNSTGRGGDGSEYYSMRGFAVQPTMVNGLPAINNGTIDPINVDNIEVIKGPSATLFGSSLISYGGLINTVTKRPHSIFKGELSYLSGSYNTNRLTADINVPVNKDVSVRVNTAYQSQNSFQDAGFAKSLFFAPSLSYKVNDKLSFLINTEFTQGNAAIAPMIFLNRYAPLTFNSIDVFKQNYKNSYTSNELNIENPTFNLQAQMFYKLSEQWTSQTAFSKSSSSTNGYYSYLWDSANGGDFTRFISKRNGETWASDLQQNFIGDFKIGQFRNRLVAGIDYYQSNIYNGSTGWAADGTVNLFSQTDNGDLTQAGVDNILATVPFEGNSTAETETLGVYFSDVFNFTDRLSAMVSLRVDNFKSKTNTSTPEEENDQTTISPKLGIVYQIIENRVSVFGNYMNGFVNIEPQYVDVDGNPTTMETLVTFDPEHANQVELGVKTNLYEDIISGSVSCYLIDVDNKLMSDPNNPTAFIQGGKVRSKGVEASFIAIPTKGLNIIAGYSYNNCEVTKDAIDSGYLGLRPEDAGPYTLVNLWANYTMTSGKLEGFGIGFGGNYASGYNALNRSNIGSFGLPAYTVLNTALSYNNDKFNFTLKLNNIANEEYFSGWSTVTPQMLRNVIGGIAYKF